MIRIDLSGASVEHFGDKHSVRPQIRVFPQGSGGGKLRAQLRHALRCEKSVIRTDIPNLQYFVLNEWFLDKSFILAEEEKK